MASARAALPWRMKGQPGTQRAIHAAAHFSAPCLSPWQVCVDNVLKTMKENANKASSILLTAVPQISQMDWAQTIKALKSVAQSSVMLPKH
ncbi:S-methyl-5'-thioadenosine phosphorylase [Takifugu flavidus]|uniref:S-methyl-5'-thioadenosine phosphorylase n=1 Tax=Takifugu flavidus TaxID=433684 RepID=A0A5C6MZ48_9TELE|nr:S-methyl-5'-thioadenosine phosphorylase [Takifugu flavidus]